MKDYTFLGIILDNSGSMSDQTEYTKNCFNEFIQDQRRLGDNVDVQITYFNTTERTKPIQRISENPNIDDYKCQGMTSLYNTLGKRVKEIGEYLSSLNETDRPDKVVITIITDGEDTYPGEYTQKMTNELISHQEQKYNWKFLFLGADPTIAKQGTTIGITNSMPYITTRDAYVQMNAFTKSVRSGN